MKKIAAIIFGLSSLSVSAQSMHATETQEKSCEVIKSSPSINSYVDALMGIEEIIPDYGVKFTFDSNSMLAKWVEKRIDGLPSKERDSVNRRAQDWANKCAIELKDTKYLWMFAGIEHRRMGFKNRVSLQKYLNNLSSEVPKTKTLDENGNLVEVVNKSRFVEYVIDQFSLRSGNINKHAAIYALYLGGGNAVEVVGKDAVEVMRNELEMVKEWSAKVQQENQKFRNIQKSDADRADRISKGQFALARNCVEIHDATKAEENLKAYVTPHNKMKSRVAKLVSFSEDRSSGVGKGVIFDGDSFAEVRTTKGTIWFNRQAIKLNSNVIVVGWYKENVTLPLVNGSSIQAPMIDAVCVQP